jgi:hypothetical protein
VAKIEPWEQRLRMSLEQFAYQVNDTWPVMMLTHYNAPGVDPDDIPTLDFENDDNWMDKLVKPARQLFDVWKSIVGCIHAEEERDTDAFNRAVQPLSDFFDGCRVEMSVVWDQGEIRVNRDFLEDESEKSFVAFALADRFLEYVTRQKDIVHLGVCGLCRQVYVKPKHGQKARYCSAACKQKAFRKRRKEAER